MSTYGIYEHRYRNERTTLASRLFRFVSFRLFISNTIHLPLFLDSGKLYSFGCNENGRLGRRDPPLGTPVPVDMKGEVVVHAAAVAYHSAVLTGNNLYEQKKGICVVSVQQLTDTLFHSILFFFLCSITKNFHLWVFQQISSWSRR